MNEIKARQYAFAAHLRDANAPPPLGVPAERLALYRELVRNTLGGLLAANFPVLHKTLQEAEWQALIAGFVRQHRAQTPLYPQLASEFIAWLQSQNTLPLPWLAELAHYEWMELCVEIAPEALPAEAVNIQHSIPRLSPAARVLAYRWPVSRIGPDFRPEQMPATPSLMLLWRDGEYRIHFAELSALTFRLLQLVAENRDANGKTLLQRLAEEAGSSGDGTFLAAAEAMLQRLYRQGTVLPAEAIPAA